jgi:hypothetical protein
VTNPDIEPQQPDRQGGSSVNYQAMLDDAQGAPGEKTKASAIGEADVPPIAPIDQVSAFLGDMIRQNGGLGGPKIGESAKTMAAALDEEQLGLLEQHARGVAAAQDRPLNASFYSDAISQQSRMASGLLAQGDREGATRQLAMGEALNRLGRRAHDAERQAALARREAERARHFGQS